MTKNNNKLKVLMVNYEFPPIGGGGGTTTRFLAKHLVKLGVSVDVLTSKPEDKDFYNHPEGFQLHYVGPLKNKITTTHLPELARFILVSIYYSRQVIKLINPDLIHSFFTLPSGCFGLWCKKKFDIPYVTSILGADVPGFDIGDWRLNVYHSLTHYLSKAIWDNSSNVVANSKTLKELGNNFSPGQNIDVITNGVDTELFYPTSKKAKSDEVQLLFVSRLMWQKGIEPLIKACGILKTRGINNYKLTIVGDGHLRNTMFSLAERFNITDRLNFLGWKKLEELPDIYRNADVFILPSVMEGMPSVVLQAMACGLPIISTKVDGFQELLEENVNGLSTKYNNSEGLANHIERLIKSEELRFSMSKMSYEKSKKFSWENIAKEYLTLYEKSLNRSISLKKEVVKV